MSNQTFKMPLSHLVVNILPYEESGEERVGKAITHAQQILQAEDQNEQEAKEKLDGFQKQIAEQREELRLLEAKAATVRSLLRRPGYSDEVWTILTEIFDNNLQDYYVKVKTAHEKLAQFYRDSSNQAMSFITKE